MKGMKIERMFKFKSLAAVLVLFLASVTFVRADDIFLESSAFSGDRFCFRNNNGTTGIQVTLGNPGECPSANPTSQFGGVGITFGPGPATSGQYTITLVNNNQPAFTMTRLGSTDVFNVAPSGPQFLFEYRNGPTLYLSATIRFYQFVQGTGDDRVVGFASVVRTGGTAQFNSPAATLVARFSFAQNQGLVDLWNNVVPPNSPWSGVGNLHLLPKNEIVPSAVPSASTVSLGGRVTNARGRGIPGVYVTVANSAGETKVLSTNTFGYYRFDELAAGQTYVISASSKRYEFRQSSLIVTANDSLTDQNFVSEQ